MTLKKGFLFQIEKQRYNSLFFRNFCTSIAVSLLLTIFFGGYTYYTDSQSFRDKIHSKNQESLYYIKSVMDDTIMSMDKIAINTKMQSAVEKFILDGTADKEMFGAMKEYVKNYTDIYRYINSVYIYAEKSKTLFTSENDTLEVQSIEGFNDLKWYEQYLVTDGNSVSIFEHKQNGTYPYLLTIVRPVSFNRKDKVGAVVINLNIIDLAELLKHDNMKQKIFLISGEGNIILSHDKTLIFKNVKENPDYENLQQTGETKTQVAEIQGKNAYITVVNSAYNDWKYVIYDFQNEYELEWTNFFWQFMQVCIVFFAVSLFVTYMLTMRNYKPLKTIMTFIDKTNDDNNEEEQQRGNYYANKLVSLILSNHNKTDDEIIHQFIGYNKAQIMALHAQIKAHFLYNMLSTIQWRAFEMTETENDVSVMIYKLGEFLKTSMEINTSILSIEAEIANARLYTELMQMRYEEVFCINWEIDEETCKYKTINICLQPIIENAIEHGLRHRKTKGMLTVQVKLHKELIQFIVTDDGIGMDSDKVLELNKMLAQGAEYNGEHVGLINVSKRLKFMFGNESSIHIESTPQIGTTVTITFPKIL